MSGLLGEPNDGLILADIFDLGSDIGTTSADILDLSDDLLVCIVIGEGDGLDLTVFDFGICTEAVGVAEFCRRSVLLVPRDLELVDSAAMLL